MQKEEAECGGGGGGVYVEKRTERRDWDHRAEWQTWLKEGGSVSCRIFV